jgi:hypothetical protein
MHNLFSATNLASGPIAGKGSNSLCRHEFIEALVRLAHHKFVATGKVMSLDKALQLLLKHHILGKPLPMQGGLSFRKENVWLLAIDDVFRTNLAALADIYRHLLGEPDPVTGRPNKYLGLKQL